MKRKCILILVAAIVAIVLSYSFNARGAIVSIQDHEMRPVAYLDFETTFNPDDYEVIDCCLEIPDACCNINHQDPRCLNIP